MSAAIITIVKCLLVCGAYINPILRTQTEREKKKNFPSEGKLNENVNHSLGWESESFH